MEEVIRTHEITQLLQETHLEFYQQMDHLMTYQ